MQKIQENEAQEYVDRPEGYRVATGNLDVKIPIRLTNFEETDDFIIAMDKEGRVEALMLLWEQGHSVGYAKGYDTIRTAASKQEKHVLRTLKSFVSAYRLKLDRITSADLEESSEECLNTRREVYSEIAEAVNGLCKSVVQVPGYPEDIGQLVDKC